MRLRLLPWVWGRLEICPKGWTSRKNYVKELDTLTKVLLPDVSLAANVKFVEARLRQCGSIISLFVKCLESLPNLHTLEVGLVGGVTIPLKKALKGVKLPQIKTMVLPPAAHPLLQHCCNVEDVFCVVGCENRYSEEFLGSLASNRDSKVKQLTIPLVSWDDPSRFVAACPRLTEFTGTYHCSPHPNRAQATETGELLDQAGSARSAISELVNACKLLPDFDTFQIVYYPPAMIHARTKHGGLEPAVVQLEQEKRTLVEEVEGMKDWALDCLRKPDTGCRGGGGKKRKNITLRVVELNSEVFYLDPGTYLQVRPITVGEYKV